MDFSWRYVRCRVSDFQLLLAFACHSFHMIKQNGQFQLSALNQINLKLKINRRVT